MTKIHHLNCASFCPACERLLMGKGSWFKRAHFCTHCLLVEDQNELILIDTGFGQADIRHRRDLPLPFRLAMHPLFDPRETAIRQVEQLGFSAQDVRHIALTHLDFDHAGGISDFPHATIHAHDTEVRASQAPHSFREKQRYIQRQFRHQPRWQNVTAAQFELDWFGFAGARLLPHIKTEIVMIPLMGHTRGHMGFAINTGDRWLLHVGDLVMNSSFIRKPQFKNPLIALVENLLAEDNAIRLHNVNRVKTLYHGHDRVEVICSHDINDLHRMNAAQRP